MTTETAEAQTGAAAEPFPAINSWESAAYVQFGVPGVPYSAIRIPLPTDAKDAAAWVDLAIKMAAYTARKYAAEFPEAVEKPRVQSANRPPPRQGGNNRQPAGNRGGYGQRGAQQGQSRAQRFAAIEGWACDECGGPCGIKPQTGQMRSPSVVCLGTCTEGDGYVKTVGWLDS